MTPSPSEEPLGLNARERWSTGLLTVLVGSASLAGLFSGAAYAAETPSWRLEAYGQDVANLLSLPVFVGAAYLASKSPLRGRLVWAGVLLFFVYAYVVYAFDVHFGRLFLVYVTALGLSVYTLLWAGFACDPTTAVPLHAAAWRTRLVAGFLVVLPVLFALLWLGEDVPALLAGTTPATVAASGLLTNPIHVLDLGFLLPGAFITGVQLWRQQPWGYALAVPMLVFLALTGAGIVAAMVLTAGGLVASAVFMGVIVMACTALAWLHLAVLDGAKVRSVLRAAA